MAVSYESLRSVFENPEFRNRVEVAMCEAAVLVLEELDATVNHLNRVKYAFRVLEQSEQETKRMLKALLPKNKAAANLAAITGVSESTLLAQVQSLWNEFSDHYAGG